MTLIISSASPRGLFQVSDRRLTSSNGGWLDDQNKAICFVAADGWFSVAYTGLATVPGRQRTDRWLAWHITERCDPNDTVAAILESVIAELQRAFVVYARSRPRWACLELSVVGIVNGEPCIGLVSNCRSADFGSAAWQPQLFEAELNPVRHDPASSIGQAVFQVVGAASAATPFVRSMLRSIRRKNLLGSSSIRAIERVLVRVVRVAAGELTIGRLISRDCMSTYIPIADRPLFACRYYPSGANAKYYCPHVISESFSFVDPKSHELDGDYLADMKLFIRKGGVSSGNSQNIIRLMESMEGTHWLLGDIAIMAQDKK